MFKNAFKIISVILATLIGAGFASGKEIYNFFAIHGKNGIAGILTSGVTICLVIICTINIIKKNNIESNKQFIKEIKGNKLIYNVLNVFLAMSFCIMISGFGSLLKQEFKIPIYMTSILICGVMYIIFTGKFERIVKFCELVVPFLIIIIIFVFVKYNCKSYTQLENSKSLYLSIIDGIIYASYNSLILIPILISVKKHITAEAKGSTIGIISATVFCVLLFQVFLVLQNENKDIKKIDLPLIYIVDGKIEKFIYIIGIEIAIITSAISAGFGFLEEAKNKNNKYTYNVIVGIFCCIAILISLFGFGNLINTVYPLFGVIGLYQILLIFRKYIANFIQN